MLQSRTTIQRTNRWVEDAVACWRFVNAKFLLAGSREEGRSDNIIVLQFRPEMEPGRPGHGSPGRLVNILGRVGSGHGSVSNTQDPVFWPEFGATKMYFLSTGALSLSACLAQATQVGYQQFLSWLQSDIDNNCTWQIILTGAYTLPGHPGDRVDTGHGSVSPGSGRVSGQYCRPGSISGTSDKDRSVQLLLMIGGWAILNMKCMFTA